MSKASPQPSTKQHRTPTTIEELAAGQLPIKLLDAINEMELSVEEVVQWERSKPAIRVTFSERAVYIETRLKIPLKRAAVVGSISGLILAVTTTILQNLDKIVAAFHT
jgi:hypothetical protein